MKAPAFPASILMFCAAMHAKIVVPLPGKTCIVPGLNVSEGGRYNMAGSYNPYEAPGQGGYGPPQNTTASGMITPLMVEHLRAARPWVRLLSILLFIGAGFTVLAAILMFVAGLLGAAMSKRSLGADAIAGPIAGVIYMIVAVVYAIPAFFMHRLANGIDNFVTQVSSSTLEDVLDKNRSYWKASGIIALAMIGLTVLLFIGAMIVGVAAGLAAKP